MHEYENVTIAEDAVPAEPTTPSPPNGSRVMDGIGADGRDQLVDTYDAGFADLIAGGGPLEPPRSPLAQAAHERRKALLDALPVGDLSSKVCVDYGVGPWGFGHVYPKLRSCGYAIGMDVSRVALEASARLSADGEQPYGQRFHYVTSRGDRLQLDDASVDLFFAGDCIENVENVDAFLDEVHRVLRPDGQLVLTTTNADAYLYRLRGARYGVSLGRLSLMAWRELAETLAPRFETVVAHGFNASVHHEWDASVTDPGFLAAWTEQLPDRPELATGVVALLRRRDDHRPARYRQRTYHADAPEITYAGTWQGTPLHRTMTARMGLDGDLSTLTLDFEGTDLLLFLWTHSWSGHAFVEIDGVGLAPVNLYAYEGGFRRLHVRGLSPGAHRVRLRGSHFRDVRSRANQLIFYQAVAYTRFDDQERPMSSPAQSASVSHNFAIRPGRFGVIYDTPADMTAAERMLLYSLILGLQPQRCLEIGTKEGGSALIIGAALDDIGGGRLVCIDPQPAVSPENWAQVSHRASLIAGPSPDLLPEAVTAAGGKFDFALIDGDHEYPGVVRDIEGTIGVLAPTAYMLFHDANYFEVARAIDDMLAKHADRLVDCGMLSVQQTAENRIERGHPVIWGGLRMVRYHQPA